MAKYLKNKDIYAENHYGKYILPRAYSMSRTARLFLCGEVYEKETIEFINNNYNDGSIIHAGCSWGDHLPALSKIVNKNSNIYAFEPNNLSYEYAIKNKLINNLENVHIKNFALGEQKSLSYINLTDKKGNILAGTSIISKEGIVENRWPSNIQEFLYNILKLKPEFFNNNSISEENVKKQKIYIETLDDHIPLNDKISIIFLDVELFEEKALLGARNILKKNKPILILEYFAEDKFNQSIIKEFGYKFKKRCNNNYIYE